MNGKVLIVDDQPDIRKLIKITLGKAIVVLEAEDGVSALNLIRRDLPRVVVLDIMMPGAMDGLQVLDAIKADQGLREVKVVMVTARGQARDYQIGMDHGADQYMIKPFSPLQLASAIRKYLQ